MENEMEELHKVLSDLENLETLASTQKVKNMLSIEIVKIKTEISNKKRTNNPTVAVSTASQPKSVPASRYEVKVTNYAWDQTSKFVKFYITLPKVHSLPADNVTCTFTDKTLKLQANDLEQRNYVFVINNLLHSIIPEESEWKIKTDTVIINAAKAKNKSWEVVTKLEKRSLDASKPKIDESEDPSANMFSLLRNIYDKGDDEMKKTLQKAWYENQNKPKGLDSMKI